MMRKKGLGFASTKKAPKEDPEPLSGKPNDRGTHAAQTLPQGENDERIRRKSSCSRGQDERDGRERSHGGPQHRREDSRRRNRPRYEDNSSRPTARRDSRSRGRSRGPESSSGPRASLNPRVFLEIAVNQNRHQTIDETTSTDRFKLTIELFEDVVPQTAERFQTYCRRGTYEGCDFFRIIPGFMMQGGDTVKNDGTGFDVVKHPDENFRRKHDRPLLLSCANSGPNTNGSQFFFTFKPQPHLNGKHVVFGAVEGVREKRHVRGRNPTGFGQGDEFRTVCDLRKFIREMESCGKASGSVVRGVCTIVDCGEIL